MTAPLKIGSAQSKPGEITYGTFEAIPLPTGGSDDFPVIIAQGKQDGPVLWVTASIHGNEYTGILAIHHLLRRELLSNLRGTLVCVPTLNPSGLRVGERRPYYLKTQDPNRLFPTPIKKPVANAAASNSLPADPEPLSSVELAYQRLFEVIVDTADYLIDLHNYSINSLPFAFRDPIGYHDEDDKASARQLQLVLDGMLNAFGHTVINEFATADYLKRNLHRSVSGAVLNTAHIPSFTVELGGYLTVDPAIVAACCAGIRNVMRWANMLDDNEMEPITGVQILNPGYPIRRTAHPYAPYSGIVDHFLKSGDPVKKGTAIGRLTDIYGRPIGAEDGLIRSDYDGFVLGISQGAAFYQNEPIASLAIRDDNELLVPFLS